MVRTFTSSVFLSVRILIWVIPFLGIQKIHACKEPIYKELRHSTFTTAMDKTNDCFKTIWSIQKMVSFMQYHTVFRIFNVKEMLLCSTNKWHQVRGRLYGGKVVLAIGSSCNKTNGDSVMLKYFFCFSIWLWSWGELRAAFTGHPTSRFKYWQ